MCRELHDHREWLWTFLDVEGVEPTNNVSEQKRLPATPSFWRKLVPSALKAQRRSSRFVETILTVVETCRQQSRNSFDYLASAMQAHFDHQSAPSLVPGV